MFLRITSKPVSLRSATRAERSAGCSYARELMSGRRTRERSGAVFMPSWYAPLGGVAVMVEIYFESDAETMPAERRAVLQGERLAGLIDKLIAAGGLQAERLTAAGVTGGGDVSLGQLADLPTTSKQDLWDTYPFGLLTVPRSEVVTV